MLAAIAALDTPGAREAYERLRAAYNSSRLRGSRAAPPFEEWQGMSSFCEDLYCRYVGAFSRPIFTLHFAHVVPKVGLLEYICNKTDG